MSSLVSCMSLPTSGDVFDHAALQVYRHAVERQYPAPEPVLRECAHAFTELSFQGRRESTVLPGMFDLLKVPGARHFRVFGNSRVVICSPRLEAVIDGVMNGKLITHTFFMQGFEKLSDAAHDARRE